MRARVLIAAAMATATFGCHTLKSTQDYTTSYYRPPRAVENGSQLRLRAPQEGETGPDYRFLVERHPLCRDGRVGEKIHTREHSYERNEWGGVLILGAAVALPLLLQKHPLEPPSWASYGAGAVGYSAWALLTSPYRTSAEFHREPIGEWTASSLNTCGRVAGEPGSQVELVASVNGSTVQFSGTSGPDGVAQLMGVRASVEGLASHCGKIDVKVSVVDRSARAVGDDSPASPYQGSRSPSGVVFSVRGGSRVALADIPDEAARALAGRCNDARLDRCLGSRRGQITTACESECALNIGAGRCNAKLRSCELVIEDESDRKYCTDKFNECLRQEGDDVSAIRSCVDQCFEPKANAQCE